VSLCFVHLGIGLLSLLIGRAVGYIVPSWPWFHLNVVVV
jgi:hypothetical protein